MRKIYLQLLLTALSSVSIAQNINLEEDSTTNLYDSRHGACAMADIDNDGDLDLLITGPDGTLNNDRTTLYSNDGLGNFTEITQTGLSILTEGGSIAFADTDGDGDQDLLLTGRNSSTYYAHFYLNDGSGNFTPDNTQPFEPSGGGNLDFADIDNDGDMDLFMTGFLAGNTRFSKLYQNDGAGNFSEITSTPFLDIGGTSSSAFFDMDNDNDLDLILTGKNNNNEKKTILYGNDGAGNFNLVSNTPFENVSNGGVAVADTDNDGDIDVLINGENTIGGFCQLYLNDGTGAFNPLAGTPFIQTIAGTADFADFDNDNDMDILVTGAADSAGAFAAHIYENQGNNNFSLVDVLATVYIPSTALGDIDNDNDLDAIVTGIANISGSSFKSRVYKNMLTTLSTGTAAIGLKENIVLYPNPSSGIFTIQTNQTLTGSIKIYNLVGELVFSEDNLNPSDQFILQLPPGMYMVVVKTRNSTSTEKLIIK